MKIAIAVNSLAHGSGIPNVAVGTANALAALGHRVWMLTLAAERRDDLSSEVEVVPVYPYARGGFRLFRSRLGRFGASRMARRAVDRLSPDVVMVHYPPLDRCFAVRGRPYQLVYFYHNVTDPALYEGAERARRVKEDAEILSLLPECDAVVANSAFTAAKVAERCPGIEPVVIHPGVDLERYRPAGPAASRQVLSVGRIVPHKGIHEMIEAFRLVREKAPQASLKLIGRNDGDPYYAEAQSRMAGLPRCELLGEMPEPRMIRELQGSAVFASCSRFEGFGMPFVEAAACGVPSVGFKAAAIGEAVSDGQTGFLVEPGDLAALAERVVRLLSDVELRRRMSEEAVRWAARFSWRSRAEAHLALYDRLLSGRKPRGGR